MKVSNIVICLVLLQAICGCQENIQNSLETKIKSDVEIANSNLPKYPSLKEEIQRPAFDKFADSIKVKYDDKNSYEIEKNESVTSPYTGKVQYQITLNIHGNEINMKPIKALYVYKNSRWEFKEAMISYEYGRIRSLDVSPLFQ
ncbi:hypothetical protein [Nostoc sp. CCY0012]|uniref:hypothetical protein n=1 Tax=Nostoc sp. CCY0012 TaxID=1056123 RepID=UPI0039C72FAF